MKKLILIAALSFSTAFSCNDLPMTLGYKLGCDIDKSELNYINENKSGSVYTNQDGNVLVFKNDKLILVSQAYQFNYSEFSEKIKMMSAQYGEPEILGDVALWDKKGIAIILHYKGKVTSLTYQLN